MGAAPKKSRVLFVEDEAPLRSTYARLFASRYEMAFAATGAEARREFVRFDPEIVVLDLRLPDADGIDVLNWIRSSGSSVRVVVTSAYASMEPQMEMLDLGFQAFLQKPFTSDQLARLIDGAADR